MAEKSREQFEVATAGTLRRLSNSRAQILGENLKRIREEKGVTRKELAERLGVGVDTVGLYENGKRLAPLDKVFDIADFFQVSVVSLTGDNGYNTEYPPLPDFDKKIFEYRFERAKEMLKYVDGFAELVGYDALHKNDSGTVTIVVSEKITYKDGVVIEAGGSHHITFKDEKVFTDFMERAADRALYRQIPFNQALIDLVDGTKKK